MNLDGIKFFHKHYGNRGGFTVAYFVYENGTIEWNYALCNPSDNFSRKIGRSIASGRLVSNRIQNHTYHNMNIAEFYTMLGQCEPQLLASRFPTLPIYAF
jgi:hypothetical protein